MVKLSKEVFPMNRKFSFLFLVLLSLSLSACSKPDIEGIVLDTTEKEVLVAKELTSEQYEEIKDQTTSQIQEDDVHGDAYRGLIYLSYDHPEEFNKGDQVEVWIEGSIKESYPESAHAKKIRQSK